MNDRFPLSERPLHACMKSTHTLNLAAGMSFNCRAIASACSISFLSIFLISSYNIFVSKISALLTH